MGKKGRNERDIRNVIKDDMSNTLVINGIRDRDSRIKIEGTIPHPVIKPKTSV